MRVRRSKYSLLLLLLWYVTSANFAKRCGCVVRSDELAAERRCSLDPACDCPVLGQGSRRWNWTPGHARRWPGRHYAYRAAKAKAFTFLLRSLCVCVRACVRACVRECVRADRKIEKDLGEEK